jgi:hypothetical protein
MRGAAAPAGAGSRGRGGPAGASSGRRSRGGSPWLGTPPARCPARGRWRRSVDGSGTAGHPGSRRRLLSPRLGRQGEGCVAVLRSWGMRPHVATSRGQDSLEQRLTSSSPSGSGSARASGTGRDQRHTRAVSRNTADRARAADTCDGASGNVAHGARQRAGRGACADDRGAIAKVDDRGTARPGAILEAAYDRTPGCRPYGGHREW